MPFLEQLDGLKAEFPALFGRFAGAIARGLLVPPSETISEWADKNRIVGEPSPWLGPWRTSRTPYLKQVMDVCSPSHPAREIDFMKPTQIGATEAALNVIAFYSSAWPQQGMVVLPDKGIASEWADSRFVGLFENSPGLAELLTERYNRKNRAKNAKLSKRLTNGSAWKFAWSTNGKVLSSTPAPILIADEADRFALRCGKEGEPIELLRNRFSNFPSGKLFKLSSPVDEGSSRIYKGFLAGDQRYYFCPCPFCNWFQRLMWGQLDWPEGGWESRVARTSQAAYKCVKCSGRIEEWRKTQLLADSVWLATKLLPEVPARGFDSGDLKAMAPNFATMSEETHPTFQINALVAPLGWPDQAWRALAAKSESASRTPEEYKVFVMTKLAEPYTEPGETPDHEKVFARRENYPAKVLLTACCSVNCYVDVQADRLEYELVGWDTNQGRWSLEYRALGGNTKEKAVWEELGTVLKTPVPTEDGGLMPILAMGIDTGNDPGMAYEFARKHNQLDKGHLGYFVNWEKPRTVVCTKGSSKRDVDSLKLITGVTRDDAVIRKLGGIVIVSIGTIFAKKGIFRRLMMPRPQEGEAWPAESYHFPNEYGMLYFEGLCSERLITDHKGEERYEKFRRNEVLDIAVGHWALAKLCGYDRIPAAKLREKRQSLMYFDERKASGPPRPSSAPKNIPAPVGDWLGGRGDDWFR